MLLPVPPLQIISPAASVDINVVATCKAEGKLKTKTNISVLPLIYREILHNFRVASEAEFALSHESILHFPLTVLRPQKHIESPSKTQKV